MAAMDRSKKKTMIWQKAAVHFLVCFVMGFFTGLAPTRKASHSSISTRLNIAPTPIIIPWNSSFQAANLNRSLTEETATQAPEMTKGDKDHDDIDMEPKKLVIVITPTSDKDPLRGVLLTRLATTLKLVSPPLLWIVVESELDDSGVSELLRKSGVMYRHLVSKENISDPRAEREHQRNLALNQIEHHRLSGIVHFAGLDSVYDLSFFDAIQTIGVFGTWPMAKLSPRRKKQIIEGPVCSSSQVIGWHFNNLKDPTDELPIHISSFAFNSSILWDPERWGRLSSSPDAKQNFLKFVKQAVVEDETELKGIPQEDCSRVNLWQLHLSIKPAPL